MEKLKALTAYLRNRDILKKAGIKCNHEKIYSWCENGQPHYLGDIGADDGLYLFDHTYKATIIFEDAAGDIRILIALILTWLEENDPDRDRVDDPNVKWEGQPYDDGTSDMEFEIWFWEKAYFGLAPAESTLQKIGYKGVDYTMADESISVAENENDTDLVNVSIKND